MKHENWRWRISKGEKEIFVHAPTMADAARLAVKKGWRGFAVHFSDIADVRDLGKRK